ncbi:MAG TPA: alpha-hydroxy acid oxidase [Streptosporangiaceae bacterium]
MKPSEIRALLRPARPELDPRYLFGRNSTLRQRRLNRCHSIGELRAAARRVLPRSVFDYVDGAADEEVSLAANTRAYRSYAFLPRALQDVSAPSLATRVLGSDLAAPFGLAPTGYSRMIHPAGELAAARAAAAWPVPYALSTVGTTSIEDVGAAGHPAWWFQLYVLRDRGLTWSLLDRAAAAGAGVLTVAVDTAVAGQRLRDVRHGFTIPPSIRLATLADIAVHLPYWTSMVASPALSFANVTPPGQQGPPTVAGMADLFDPSVTWDDLAKVRAHWPGRLLVKGPLGPADARRAVSLGADGVHLSNHGGRQLDRTLAPLHLVRPVREALGEDPVIAVDSGIRHGSDIAVALARGADLCLVGRAYLYGLAAGGEAGVRRAIDLLASELRRTMQLCGVTTVAALRAAGDDIVVPRDPGEQGRRP